MKPELVDAIEARADRLVPDSPFLRHQRLFSERDFDLDEENGTYEEQMKDLEARRQDAVQEVATDGGVQAVVSFAKAVQSPWRVGIALWGNRKLRRRRSEFCLICSNQRTRRSHSSPVALPGADSIVKVGNGLTAWTTSRWTPSKIGQLLCFLPFTLATWERARNLLGADQSAYWTEVSVNPYEADTGLETAIEQLLQNGRPGAAIGCLYRMLHDQKPFDKKIAIRTLLAAIASSETPHSTTDPPDRRNYQGTPE